ncbi:MAG: hypothetical protein Q9M94_06805 [Candidatus Gracilibacteria bacterium]|nr:hypothetical protein [Candidatus Gracilibacteria bacterium]
MKIIIKKDGEGFLAEVEKQENIFAYGNTKEEAKNELLGVVEMMMDYHLELIEKERQIKKSILNFNFSNYALQV